MAALNVLRSSFGLCVIFATKQRIEGQGHLFVKCLLPQCLWHLLQALMDKRLALVSRSIIAEHFLPCLHQRASHSRACLWGATLI